MPYIGEVLVVQKFILDMTGHSIHKDTIKEALERAEQFRTEESRRRDRGD